jgi:type II secretory pathway pseudopilin PulG
VTGRDRKVIVVVALVIAVVAVWFLVISPKRDEANKLGAQVKSAQQQLDSARSQIAIAEADRAAYARNYRAVAQLGEAVPSDDNTPSLIYQLQDAASRAGVDFRSLALSAGASTTTAPAASTPGTSQVATATLPPGAAVGPAGLPTLPFTFNFQGSFFHLANFLGRLQRFVVATNNKVTVSGRLMSLNAINFAPGAQGFPDIAATISATAYLVPASQGATNGASPSGPAASASPQSVSSSTSTSPPTAAVTP